MPTVLSHPAVPLAMGLALGRKTAPPALIIAGVAVSVLPDLDILTWHFGISLSHEFGHRGFSHSILFAALAAAVCARMLRAYKIPWTMAAGFLFISIVSHGVLDAFTNGGTGIAFYWPWSKARFFAPYRVIQIAPIHLERILSNRIPIVLVSEILWIWFPLAVMSLSARAFTKFISPRLPLFQTLSDHIRTTGRSIEDRLQRPLRQPLAPGTYKNSR